MSPAMSINEFLDAINDAWRRADAELLRQGIADDDPEVVLIGTDAAEVVVGGAACAALVAEQAAAVDSLEVHVRERHVRQNGDVAWFTALVDLRATVGGQTLEIPGVRQTGVVERRDGRWRIVQGHMSLGVRMPSP